MTNQPNTSNEADKPCSCSVCYAQSKEQTKHPEKIINGVVYVTNDGSNWTVKEAKVMLWGRRTGKTHTTLHALGYTKNNCPICQEQK